MFPQLPQQSGYNKWLPKLSATMAWLVRVLGAQTNIAADDVWVVVSTPVEAPAPARPSSAPTLPAGRVRLPRLYTPGSSGLSGCIWSAPCRSAHRLAFTGAKADERHALHDILAATPIPAAVQAGGHQTMIGDKNYYGAAFEAELANTGIELLRPARKGEPARTGERFFKPLRQVIESINDTLKGQLDLEAHGGRTSPGSAPASLRASSPSRRIWHNDNLGLSACRSLTAYDQYPRRINRRNY